MFSTFLRRALRPLVLLVTFSLIFSACAPAATPATPTVQATEEQSAYPVTIEHKYGSTTIDKFPKRIVLVGLTEQDAMLALGIVPVATSEWYGKRPGAIFDWAKDKLGSAPVPVVLNSVEINFEQIASLKPDLIVGLYAGITQDTYNTLSKIAPTVAQPKEYVDYGIPWQELTRKIGLIVGKSQEAEALIAGVETNFAEAKSAHPEFAGKTGVVASTWGFDKGNYYAYHSQDPRNRFMTALGFTVPAEIDEMAGKEYGASISLERLEIVDTDALVWITLGDKEVQEQKSNALYSKTKATKEGRDIFLVETDPVYDALNFMTVLSIPFALEKMLPRLTAAVDGDPSTLVEGQPAPVAADPAFPVTIEHKFGSTTIVAEPKRVISLGYSEQDAILALGIVPIAIRDWFGDQPHGVWPWSQKALGDAKPELLKMGFGELNFEQLAALKPDLIVATHSGITQDEYTKLAQIAPTLAQPGKYDDFATPWQEQTLLIGQALGRSEKAQALVKEVEAKINAAAAAHPEFAKASIAWLTPSEASTEYWVVGPNTPPLRFLQKLGFQYPSDVATLVGTTSSGKISTEKLDMVDTGVLIIGSGSKTGARGTILADPLFQNLKAFKEGRIIFFTGVDPVYGALSFSTVTSLSYLVDQLVPQLVAAADGDPATTVP